MSSAVSYNIKSTIQSLLNNWIANHPVIGFFVSHPILGLILLITIILTIWAIIQMIPVLVGRIWLFIFKSPFIFRNYLAKNNSQKVIPENINFQQEKCFQQILNKLQTIEAKQNQLEKQLLQLKKIKQLENQKSK